MIAFVVTLVFGGTQAFFSDTETSTGNTFSAGAIDLLIDNTSYGFDWNNPNASEPNGTWGPNPNNSWQLADLTNQLFFSFDDLKPGDYGEDTISLHVNDNDAYACMAFDLTGTPENGQNEPEAEVDLTAGADEGELQNHLSFLFWLDDGDNVYETDETLIPELSGLPGSIFTGNWLPIAEGGDEPLPGDTTQYIGKGWCFGEMTAAPATPAENPNGPTPGNTGFTCNGAGDHNVAQTDGLIVDVAFHAEQSRNNDQFSCAALPPLDDEGDENIGALLSAYTQPTETCDAFVDDSFVSPVAPNFLTIQAAIDHADTGNGDTVCVADGTYNEDVVINKEITLAGDGATATSIINGVAGSQTGAVSIAANNVTLSGFEINGVDGSVAAVRVTGAHSGATVSYNKITGGNAGGAVDTVGGQSNHTFTNNEFVGDAGTQLVYINGLASVNVASDNVDFTNNTFSGAAIMALGQEAWNSSVTQNVFDTVTSFTDVEDWGSGNNFNQNNFNDGDLNLQHSENGNTGDTGITGAENNWWGDTDASDGDVNPNADVDFEPEAPVAFPEN